ncbi:hypothetical protein LCGC14_2776890, partial [marine sediment metagenome]
TCHLIIYNEDDAFDWINEWLAIHPYTQKSRRLRLTTFWGINTDDSKNEGKWSLSPGLGGHLLWYKGLPLWLERIIKDGDESRYSSKRREQIEIRVLGRSSLLIRELLMEASQLRKRENKIDIFLYSEDYWQRVSSKLPRKMSSVVLPKKQTERILHDANWFFNAADWYRERGVPYRRGYLFSGPPGCGKTSLVLALASYFCRPIYVLNLGDMWIDSKLFSAICTVPVNGILLIEDVDIAGKVRGATPEKKTKKGDEKDEPKMITMSGLLNGIDGVISKDGRLLIMTTNYPNRLDVALIRPGRIDMHERIEPLIPTDMGRLFLNFFPDESELANQLSTKVSNSIPAAEIQSVLMINNSDPVEAFIQIVDRGK